MELQGTQHEAVQQPPRFLDVLTALVEILDKSPSLHGSEWKRAQAETKRELVGTVRKCLHLRAKEGTASRTRAELLTPRALQVRWHRWAKHTRWKRGHLRGCVRAQSVGRCQNGK